MMADRELCRGLFIIATALFFGLQSFRYNIGNVAAAGPGLFPLIVSSSLFVIGIGIVVRSRYSERLPLQFGVKSIGIILGSLVAFALVSQYVNMICGILVMTFMASLAAPSYSLVRNLQISVVLVAIALAFQKLLGLELPLY